MLNEESFEWDITSDNLTGTSVLYVSLPGAYQYLLNSQCTWYVSFAQLWCHIIDLSIRYRSIWHHSPFQKGYLKGLQWSQEWCNHQLI